jgi:hypothetical protein
LYLFVIQILELMQVQQQEARHILIPVDIKLTNSQLREASLSKRINKKMALSIGTGITIGGGISFDIPTPGAPSTVEILLVAGGGAGGGSGGGAGGLLYYGSETPKTPNGSARSVSASTVYTITIGGGGTSSGNGSNTSISGTGLSLTALGGTGSTVAGQTGGSGNGADRTNPSIIGFGTAGQGYNGGTGNSGNNSSGGGGGAGGLGGNSGANGKHLYHIPMTVDDMHGTDTLIVGEI